MYLGNQLCHTLHNHPPIFSSVSSFTTSTFDSKFFISLGTFLMFRSICLITVSVCVIPIMFSTYFRGCVCSCIYVRICIKGKINGESADLWPCINTTAFARDVHLLPLVIGPVHASAISTIWGAYKHAPVGAHSFSFAAFHVLP